MKNLNITFILIIILALASRQSLAQKDKNDSKELNSQILKGLTFRNIGPALTSGRIADFAVNPDNHSEYYVAVASGHVWKTTNKGTTFKPIFDKYGAYSMGCISIDPNNHNIIWLGTGENNHQRVLGYGNGIYKSNDGGKSWKNMGLKNARQIGMILIQKGNSNVVFAAAEGSAWAAGNERGLYKTTDGGKNWKKVLEISENTGVNNIIADPNDENILYATSEQRRRHVQTKIGGGPESAIYKSYDAGETWKKLTSGLPTGHLGGIGIAVSPVNSNYVYAIIEAEGKTGGFFRSTDKGESWQKMNDYSTSGQYYGEIYCDPKNKDKVFATETFSKYTEDGGKTWKGLGLSDRHVDDHALWINPNNTNNLIIGGDGGIYETYDMGANWRHISNLPVTQFYRVYLDNAKPFYNVYGGTQDNNSIGGPSRNTSKDGVTAAEWFATLGGDGFQGAVDPENPNIVYSEYQYGNLYRYDKKSKEALCIKPRPKKDELTYRWNWNTPFMISPHNSKRLYIAANKLFRSENRGNSWTTISQDLTANIDRNTWKVMGKFWSSNAVVKDMSTSLFGTITAIDESPVREGLLYVGCDDGMFQVSDDGGKNWRKANNFPNLPEYSYVSDIRADRFDENTVYVSLINIKRDDFKPYLYKSTNKGKSWKSISNNLPENGSVRAIQQDFKKPELLFAGTEFGFFFSINGGKKWIQLNNGLPDIQVSDIALQQRENDIVIATFGRGFFILDDYSPLRILDEEFTEKNEAYMFPVKDALQFIQTEKKYGQGGTVWYAPNPAYGATFTYFLKEVPKTQKQLRKEKEAELFKSSEKIPQLSLKELEDEAAEETPYLLFTIRDKNKNIVKKFTASPTKGVSRITWDLSKESARLAIPPKGKYNPLQKSKSGFPVAPGKYSVEMGLYNKSEYKKLTEPIIFKVKRLKDRTFPAMNISEQDEYFTNLHETAHKIHSTDSKLKEMRKEIAFMRQTLLKKSVIDANLDKELKSIDQKLYDLHFKMYGVKSRVSYEEIPPHKLPIYRRLINLYWTHSQSTSDISTTEKEQLSILQEELNPVISELKELTSRMEKAKQDLDLW